MQVTRFPDPRSFLARAEPFLLRREAENILMLGLGGMTRAFGEDAYLATVEDADAVVACAFRTPPHKAVITRAAPAALECLAADLATKYPDLPEVLGPEPDVAAFADAWARQTGLSPIQGMRERLFEIRETTPLTQWPAGRLRIADEGDLPTAIAWTAAFITEVLPGDATNPETHAAARIAARNLFVWDDGGPVSTAGWASGSARGVRVNFVYTPPEYRGRGYATACVARLTQQLLDEGREFCCLYTDVSNPTSNRIYQRIGYRPICDLSNYLLNSRKADSIRRTLTSNI